MRSFEESYAIAIEEIKKLDNGGEIIFHPHFSTVARTLGAEHYSEYAAGLELIKEFIAIKHDKNISVYFYLTNINSEVMLQGLRSDFVVNKDWVEKHPEIKLIEL